MQVPLSWLKEYVDLELPPRELARALTMAGLETEPRPDPLSQLQRVVTARIEKINPHPNADKLSVCQVKPGEDQPPLTIVCGATNIREGQIVPLALPGAVLAEGFTLKKTKIRGVESQGMMCSQKELGVGEDHEGIWILPPETEIGKPLAEALKDRDLILETEPTPNRGDLLSIIGVAREVSAITRGRVRLPRFSLEEKDPPAAEIAKVIIEDYQGCPRYCARVIQGVKIGPSPEWLQKRLEAAGMRPINNVVDVTNYVMLELGQPLHAFDLDKLEAKTIVVKRADQPIKFKTLDGVERDLPEGALLICDREKPVALAGIMGGEESEVSETTTDLLIESACFNPVVIRRTARLIGLQTEASRRFDKGVDPLNTGFAADRAAAMIQELAGGEVRRGLIDEKEKEFEPPRIKLRTERTGRILGLEIDKETQKQTLLRIPGLELEEREGILEVIPPSYRPDLTAEHDLIEEIARLSGYENIPASMPSFQMQPLPAKKHLEFGRKLRERMAALGFRQVLHTAFDDPARLEKLGLPPQDPRMKPVRPRNPISASESILRTTLIPKLLACLALNRSRGYTREVKIYELNAIFLDQGEEFPREKNMLAGLLAKPAEKTLWPAACPEDGFFELKRVAEQVIAASGFPGARILPHENPEPFLHPGKAAKLMIGSEPAGVLGALHPKTAENFELKTEVFIFEINFDMVAEKAHYVPKAAPLSKFPPALRDIAIVVDEEVKLQDIMKSAGKTKTRGINITMTLFDIFRGGNLPPGKKSMAFHVRYQSMEKTLTDEEVNQAQEQLLRNLEKSVGAILR